MKFSIVTVSFNQARFLEAAMQSVFAQSYRDIEYIVVDAGSTDGSRDLIRRNHRRISKTVFEPDKGAADGLNKGFALASGDVYAFLNSDDVLLPGAIARVAAHFVAHPETDILMGHAVILDEDGNAFRRAYTDRFEPALFAYSAGITCQHSTFFRAELFHQTKGFDANNKVAWDAELFLDLLLAARHPLYVDDFLGGFRIHRNSITGSNRMAEDYRAYERARFARIMGRPWRHSDWVFWLLYRLRKYARSPRALWEVLRRGSIR